MRWIPPPPKTKFYFHKSYIIQKTQKSKVSYTMSYHWRSFGFARTNKRKKPHIERKKGKSRNWAPQNVHRSKTEMKPPTLREIHSGQTSKKIGEKFANSMKKCHILWGNLLLCTSDSRSVNFCFLFIFLEKKTKRKNKQGQTLCLQNNSSQREMMFISINDEGMHYKKLNHQSGILSFYSQQRNTQSA